MSVCVSVMKCLVVEVGMFLEFLMAVCLAH